jgi:signal transduction histidine kinase
MQQEPFNLEAAIIAVTIVFLVLAAFIVMIMLVYRKRRNMHIIEKINIQSAFKQELLKTKIEMQEQTLSHISREIHDNITQVLSFVKLNLAMVGTTEEQHKQLKINESRELVSQVITDLRDLSKSLSFEHITQWGLVKTIQIETERINKSGIISVMLLIEGKPYSLGEQRELVLFRIFQESLNNTLKHSGANQLKITLEYIPELFNLTLEDNGSGFLINSLNSKGGSGLKNMENRATLIGAVANITSSAGKGCSIKVTLNPLEQHLYIDGNHPDSIS